jgi:hypothetical protein
MQEAKYCVDCKHFNTRDNTCYMSGEIDLVTGTTKYKLASIMRYYDTKTSCNQHGQFFEPIPYTEEDLDDLSNVFGHSSWRK